MDTTLIDAVSKVDTAFKFIFGISFIILFLITAVTLYFLYRYSRKRNPEPSQIEGNLVAELIWTIVPCIIVGAMFWYGWVGYKALREAPADSYEVKCTARMWSWKFEYPNGKTSDKLYVPADTPIKVDLTSVDVIHSFYVAAFRVKMDTVPGMHTYVWFNSGEPAEYEIQCAEYCGVRHSYMLSKVVVVPKEEFDKWLNASSSAAEAPNEGEEVMKKHGCFDCHTTDGTELVGPSFKDIYGRDTVVIENGKEKTVKADDAYIEKSILEPGADIVKGYEDMMPPTEVSKEELAKMLEYFKGGGKPAVRAGAKGAEVAEREGCTGCHSVDGSEMVGPSFKGLMDRKTTVLKDGKKMEVTANVEYIISSIKHPSEYVVDGFEPSMPEYESLSDDDMKALIEYISTLK